MDNFGTSDGQWSILAPKNSDRPNFYIPKEFGNRILLHILKNSIKDINPPLILAIQGPKGEGKTSQTRELCSRLGIYVISISGSAISGVHEKEPVLILQQAYLKASSIKQVHKALTVILIDDLDTSVAAVHEERRYTVNSQLVNGFLMNLADDPYHIGDKLTMRIPIIITGNDFTKLYEPLTRHGRSVFFDWIPNKQLKIDIVRNILRDHLNNKDIEKLPKLIDKYFLEPISFWHDIKNDLYDSIILDYINISDKDIKELENKIMQVNPQISIDYLYELCNIKQNSKAKRFLR